MKIGILFCSVFLIVGCAAPKATVRTLLPAKHHETTQYKNISVLPFAGHRGDLIASELESELVNININGKPFFNVVERVQLEYALSELELGQTGLIDSRSAVKVGKMIGAEGMYTGQLITLDVDEQYYTEDRRECVQHKDPKNVYSDCVTWQNKAVNCSKKIATFHFAPKLIVVASGRVVYAKNIQETAEDSSCVDQSTTISTDQALLAQAKRAAFKRFVRDVAPTYSNQDIDLIDDVKGLSEASSQSFSSAIDFAEKGRMDRACQLWKRTLEVNGKGTFPVLYNLGLCAETAGNYNQAQARYQQADQLLASPNETVSAAVTRIQEKIRQQRKLRQQL